MSDQKRDPKSADPAMKSFLEFWGTYVEQGNENTKRLPESINWLDAPQAARRRWLDTLSKSMEAYMRSPAFLQTMKQQIDTLVQTKKQMDRVCHDIAHASGMPSARDINGLLERLQGVEKSILSRLSDIERRLESIEDRLHP